jgi:hypothetical protein
MMERIIRTRATARGAKVRLRHQPKTEFNGKRGKANPFGLIVVQRTDVVGPAAQATAAKAADAAKAERARVRAEKKAATLAGIKPAKKAAPRNGVRRPTKAAAPVKKTVSKRAARKVGV